MPVITNDSDSTPEVIFHGDTSERPPPSVTTPRSPHADEATAIAITRGSALEVVGGGGAVVQARCGTT